MFRVAAVLTVALMSSVAFADEATARKNYDAGERAYNLGDFDKAAELFKQAYEDWPEPAFLFNIAQTYRQKGDCKQAAFFYKRFLALKQNDTKKPIKPELQKEVEKRIVELDECTRREIANRPPDQLDNGANNSTTAPSNVTGTKATTTPTTSKQTSVPQTGQVDNQSPEGDDEDDEETPTPAPATGASMISLRADGGVGKLKAGDLSTPVSFAGAIVGGYPLSINDKLSLELGAAISFSPLGYTTSSNQDGNATLIVILANVAPSVTIMPKLSARLDVGAGVLVFACLGKEGNPFTMDGIAATGALSAFHARVAVSADYLVTPNVVLTATPFAFSYSPAPSGLNPTISSLTMMTFLVGVGYRR